jgi:hypothetical protein
LPLSLPAGVCRRTDILFLTAAGVCRRFVALSLSGHVAEVALMFASEVAGIAAVLAQTADSIVGG